MRGPVLGPLPSLAYVLGDLRRAVVTVESLGPLWLPASEALCVACGHPVISIGGPRDPSQDLGGPGRYCSRATCDVPPLVLSSGEGSTPELLCLVPPVPSVVVGPVGRLRRRCPPDHVAIQSPRTRIAPPLRPVQFDGRRSLAGREFPVSVSATRDSSSRLRAWRLFSQGQHEPRDPVYRYGRCWSAGRVRAVQVPRRKNPTLPSSRRSERSGPSGEPGGIPGNEVRVPTATRDTPLR